MSTNTATTRDELRQRVHDLITEGLSNRAIAARLPVGKDTVRRWRAAAVHGGAPADAPPAAPDAPPAPDPRATNTEPAPPDPGQLVLDIDADLRTSLAVFSEAGLTPQQAITTALRFVGDAVADAWDHDVCPRGLLPTMRIRSIHPAARLPPSSGRENPLTIPTHRSDTP